MTHYKFTPDGKRTPAASDEDVVAFLKDIVAYRKRRIVDLETDMLAAKFDIRRIKNLLVKEEEQLKWARQKVETGEGTCGRGLPWRNCSCEGCRYEYYDLEAPDLGTAIARRRPEDGFSTDYMDFRERERNEQQGR